AVRRRSGDRNGGNCQKPRQVEDGTELALIRGFVRRFNLNAERSRAEARSDAEALRGEADVCRNLGRTKMRTLFVNCHIDLAEFELGDDSKRLLERITRETERGTCDVHGCLLRPRIEASMMRPAARRL